MLRSIITLFTILPCFIALSGSGTESEQHIRFEHEDVVVFIGDSITHGGSYHTNLALFYATRFPNKHVKYVNGGISGDTSMGTLARFDRDIAIHQPSVATVMLGMNDVGRYLYEHPAKDEPALSLRIQKQREIRQDYLINMRQLLDKLAQLNTRVILLTPSIFDQTVQLTSPTYQGINDALALFADELEPIAHEYGAQVIDFQQPMLAVNERLQQHDPSATVVSRDRVHPGAPGHFLMTYAFLAGQLGHHVVSDIVIYIDDGQKQVFEGCPARDKVDKSPTSVSFTCQPESLPFPVAPEQKVALQWVPFQRDFNQQRLAIKGLLAGQYEIKIDGTSVGVFTHAALDSGINLAVIESTPMFQQALKVKSINDERATLSSKIRDIAQVKYSMLDKYPDLDRNDPQALRNTLFAHVENSKGKPWYGYLKKQVNTYLQEAHNEVTYRQQIEALHNKLYQANKPLQHHWEVSRVGVL